MPLSLNLTDYVTAKPTPTKDVSGSQQRITNNQPFYKELEMTNPLQDLLIPSVTPAPSKPGCSPLPQESYSQGESYSPQDIFVCPEESQFYSQCFETLVLSQCKEISSIVEFGAGDGTPVIDALLKRPFHGTIDGYELNPLACKVAEFEIKQHYLAQTYVVHNQCFFSHASRVADCLIANPPYLPAPDANIAMPSLHGGIDGATITKQLLTHGCPQVLLMISAYSNPIETVEYAIAHHYCVADFLISPLQFGYYSSEPKVRNTISQLRQEQKAFYSHQIYFLAGVLFKQASTSQRDLSHELLKVMTAL